MYVVLSACFRSDKRRGKNKRTGEKHLDVKHAGWKAEAPSTSSEDSD